MCGVDTSLVQACRQQREEQKAGKCFSEEIVTDEETSKVAVQILKRAPVIVKRKVALLKRSPVLCRDSSKVP